MQSNTPDNERSGNQPGADGSVRPWLRNILIAAGLLSIAAVALLLRKGQPAQNPPENQASAASERDSASKELLKKPARDQRTDAGSAGNEAAIANSFADRATAVSTPNSAPTAKPT